MTRVFDRSWEQFIPFWRSPELRRVIYTTNSIESLNYQMRKVIKNRGQFPNDAAAVKLLWLAICNIEDKRAAERAKERAQKRCRTAPDDSWKDRWSPTGRALEQLMLVYPTASSHTCKHCWKAQQTKNQTTDLHKNLTRWKVLLRPATIAASPVHEPDTDCRVRAIRRSSYLLRPSRRERTSPTNTGGPRWETGTCPPRSRR